MSRAAERQVHHQVPLQMVRVESRLGGGGDFQSGQESGLGSTSKLWIPEKMDGSKKLTHIWVLLLPVDTLLPLLQLLLALLLLLLSILPALHRGHERHTLGRTLLP